MFIYCFIYYVSVASALAAARALGPPAPRLEAGPACSLGTTKLKNMPKTLVRDCTLAIIGNGPCWRLHSMSPRHDDETPYERDVRLAADDVHRRLCAAGDGVHDGELRVDEATGTDDAEPLFPIPHECFVGERVPSRAGGAGAVLRHVPQRRGDGVHDSFFPPRPTSHHREHHHHQPIAWTTTNSTTPRSFSTPEAQSRSHSHSQSPTAIRGSRGGRDSDKVSNTMFERALAEDELRRELARNTSIF